MLIKGKDLQLKFNALFDFQKEQEDKINPQNKKALKNCAKRLAPKKPLNTLSPLFQDPDLLVQLVGGDVQFLTGRSKTSRRRNLQEAVTTSRPQAKDVSSSRVHEDADIANDTVLDGFYHHPKGPKKRIYIAESEDSSPLRVSPVDGEDDNTLYSVAPSLSELALPTHSVTKRYKHDEASQEEDDNSVEELETFLNNTVNLLKSSTLDTVNYDEVYSLLPRLTPIRQYKYVNSKEWSVSNNQAIGTDTVYTITIFSEVDKHVRMQEIEILGSQELYRLRRTIVCPFGYGVHQHKRHQKQRTRSSPRQQDDDQQDDDQQDDDQQDDDQQEEVENDVLNESLYYENDSSIMFIEDTFYTDSKNPSIERHMTDWLAGKTNKTITDFPRRGMGRMMKSMSFNLNKPYCFLHYGKCEHMCVVKDIRLLSDTDNIESFPRTNFTLSYSRYKCSMCSIFPAIFMTKNDILSGFSPCYFCNNCYYSFHPDTNAATNQHFETLPYYGDII